MRVEVSPRLSVAVWNCHFHGCSRKVPKGMYLCEEHRLPGMKQSEPVISEAMAARNALVLAGECYVYAIAGADLVKIGKAIDVEDRLSRLKTGCPVDLRLIGSVRGPNTLERDIHAWGSAHRVRGEWFAKVEPIMALVAAIELGDLAGVLEAMKNKA